jgi:hypothetical protein
MRRAPISRTVDSQRRPIVLYIAILAVAVSGCRATAPVGPVWSRGEFGPRLIDPAGCDAESASKWEMTFVQNDVVLTRRRFESVRRDRMPYDVDLSGVLLQAQPGGAERPEVRRAPHDATAPSPLDDEARRRARIAARAVRRVVEETSLGWLVAFDGGQQGGSLWWFPAKPGDGRLLWPGSIRFLEPMGTDVVALSGSGHLDVGLVLTLSRHPIYGWVVRSPGLVPSQPSARLRVAPDRLLIGARTGLYELRDGRVTPIVEARFPDDPLTVARSSQDDFALNFRNHALLVRRRVGGFTPEWFRLPECRHMRSR